MKLPNVIPNECFVWSKLDLAFSECFATRGDPGFLKNNICCFFFITLLLTQACFNQQGEDIQSSGKCINHKAIPVGIGEDTQIKKAVIDKNARIGKNVLVLWKIHQSSSIHSSKTSCTSLLSTSAFAESCYICSLHILFSMLKPNLIITVMQIINKDGVQEGDREANGYIISEGIVVIIHGAEIADGSII